MDASGAALLGGSSHRWPRRSPFPPRRTQCGAGAVHLLAHLCLHGVGAHERRLRHIQQRARLNIITKQKRRPALDRTPLGKKQSFRDNS